MSLQAYIDESFDSVGTGLYVLAGYIATSEQWELFQKEWEQMLSLGSLASDGTRHFKMSEMAMSEDRMSRVPFFHAIINRHVSAGVSVSLNSNDILPAIERLEAPDGYHIVYETRPFTLAYNFLMSGFHRSRAEELIDLGSEPVDFCFDETGEKESIIAGWKEFVNGAPEDQRHLYGLTPRFENDRTFLPLQAADFKAWWIREWIEKYGPPLTAAKCIYPYTPQSHKIRNIIINVAEDDLVAHYMYITSVQHGILVKDRGRASAQDDPAIFEEFPLPKLVKRLTSFFRRV